MEFRIPEEHRHASGIYAMRSRVDGRVYVGMAVNLHQRYKTHLAQLKQGAHPNVFLQVFVADHSIHALEFKLLELCGREELAHREVHHINQLRSVFIGYGFNIKVKWANLNDGKEKALNSFLVAGYKDKFLYTRYGNTMKLLLERVHQAEDEIKDLLQEIKTMEMQMESLRAQAKDHEKEAETWERLFYDNISPKTLDSKKD